MSASSETSWTKINIMSDDAGIYFLWNIHQTIQNYKKTISFLFITDIVFLTYHCFQIPKFCCHIGYPQYTVFIYYFPVTCSNRLIPIPVFSTIYSISFRESEVRSTRWLTQGSHTIFKIIYFTVHIIYFDHILTVTLL